MAEEYQDAVLDVKPKKTAKKYKLSKLRGDCRKLYGVSTVTFVGATADLADGEYTIDEIKKKLDKWRKKEVK